MLRKKGAVCPRNYQSEFHKIKHGCQNSSFRKGKTGTVTKKNKDERQIKYH